MRGGDDTIFGGLAFHFALVQCARDLLPLQSFIIDSSHQFRPDAGSSTTSEPQMLNVRLGLYTSQFLNARQIASSRTLANEERNIKHAKMYAFERSAAVISSDGLSIEVRI